MDLSHWILQGTQSAHLTSLSVSQNVQADCTLNASFRKPTDGFSSLPKIGDTVTYSVDLYTALAYDVPQEAVVCQLIKARVDSVNIDADSYQITASTEFNNFVKAGKVQELNYMTPEQLNALFDIQGTPSIQQQREYFESAAKFNGAVYYSNDLNLNSLERTTVEDVLEATPKPAIPPSFLAGSGAISAKKDDGGNDSTPNVYDIVYNVKFTRINTLVKSLKIEPDDALPSGIRQIVAIPVGDGSTYDAYGTYDRPPKKSILTQAIEASGWTVDPTSVSAEYRTTNIVDVDGSTIIHTADSSDDLIRISLKATRRFNQNAALPIVARIYNRKAISRLGQVNYKKVEKTFTYSYSGNFVGSNIISNYYDVVGNDYLNAMDGFILKAKYEMGTTGLSLLTGSYNENVILSANFSSPDKVAEFLNDPLPFQYSSNIGDAVVVMGRSFSFDVNSGSASLNIQAKFVKDLDKDAEVPGDLTIPDPVVVPSNSSPHNAIGAGNLSVNGPSSWWTNDTLWAFENDVTLKHYYSYYIPGTTLQENTNPELTVTNYYLHDTYKNAKYENIPYEAVSEQSRIKYDRQKTVYTVAISLPQLTYPDIEL